MAAMDWLLLIFLSILWGGSFFFAKIAVAEIPPMTLVLIRVGGAALVLWAILLVRGLGRPGKEWPGKEWIRPFLLMGLINNVIPFWLIFWGQQTLSSGVASVLYATTPVFSVLLAWGAGEGRPGPLRLLGVLLGVAGVAAMVGPGIVSGFDLGQSGPMLLLLLGACSYAVAGRFGRRFGRLPPLVVAAGQVSGSSVILLPVAAWLDRPWTLPLPGMVTLLSLAGLVCLSTALAYCVYFRLLARVGATNTLLVTLLVPVSATLLGAFVLQEAVGLPQVAGMAAIGLGLLLIDGRIFRRG
jgi:drug/metabolite transporter (DMT)-like permease